MPIRCESCGQVLATREVLPLRIHVVTDACGYHRIECTEHGTVASFGTLPATAALQAAAHGHDIAAHGGRVLRHRRS